MAKHKPAGWPRHMAVKRLKGSTAYFWQRPPWARAKLIGGKPCPVKSQALGADYGEAKAQAEALNEWLDQWRTGRQPVRERPGSIDWMCETFLASSKCTRLSPDTQANYRTDLGRVRDHRLKNGQRFGERMVRQVTPEVADRLYEKLRARKDGEDTLRLANGCMVAMRRAWNVVHRLHSREVPKENPFAKMGLERSAKVTVPASREQLDQFIAAADVLGLSILGTAAMLCFELVQRPDDVFTELAWSHYRPEDHPSEILVRDSKTGQETWLPLIDADGSLFYPELEARLSRTPRHGPLVIMSPRVDKKRRIHMPYTKSWRSAQARKIRARAKLPDYVTLTAFRHGGLTEMGDAALTDQEMQAHGRHKTRQMLSIYAKRTLRQKRNAARKRRTMVVGEGTNQAQMSE